MFTDHQFKALTKKNKLPDKEFTAGILIYGIGDVITTVVGMVVFDLVENNPIASEIYLLYGLEGLITAKIMLVLFIWLFWIILTKRLRDIISYTLIITGSLAVNWNTYLMIKTTL